MKMRLDMSCVECDEWFLYSDPNVYDFDDGTDSPFYCICKNCLIKIAKKRNWHEQTKG